MSSASATSPPTDRAPIVSSGHPRRRHRRRWILVIGATVLVAAVIAVVAADPFAQSKAAKGAIDNSYPTSTGTVARRDLSSQTQLAATLGYAGNYSVVNQTQGTVTSLPNVGQVISQGQVLYRVSGQPVVLLYGTTPSYRSLSEGASWSDVTGTDVAELNADLVALGYATLAELPAGTDEFTWWTKQGVEKLQAALGVKQDGTLGLGQAVFLPGAVRVTSTSATLGAPAQPGQPVLSATTTARQVSIAVDADQQSEVKVGDKVTITLPDNQTTPGVIASVGTVATAPASGSSNTSPTVTVLVNPTNPAATGTWDQAPVNVTITTGTATDALVVPVTALMSQPGGAYAVEVVGTDGTHHLLAVSLGLFDNADGLVQITGSTVTAGQQVVIPAS
jgi:hypothetical protein